MLEVVAMEIVEGNVVTHEWGVIVGWCADEHFESTNESESESDEDGNDEGDNTYGRELWCSYWIRLGKIS